MLADNADWAAELHSIRRNDEREISANGIFRHGGIARIDREAVVARQRWCAAEEACGRIQREACWERAIREREAVRRATAAHREIGAVGIGHFSCWQCGVRAPGNRKRRNGDGKIFRRHLGAVVGDGDVRRVVARCRCEVAGNQTSRRIDRERRRQTCRRPSVWCHTAAHRELRRRQG